MACPTCDHTMSPLGQLVAYGDVVYWCPRCGTIRHRQRGSGAEWYDSDEAPKLPGRVLEFLCEIPLVDVDGKLLRDRAWVLGVTESCSKHTEAKESQ